jgi:hypothetical protein
MVLAHHRTGRNSIIERTKDSFLPCEASAHFQQVQKGEASYEIHSLLAALGERSDVIKATVELHITILNQHDVKMAAAFKRGRPGSGRARSHSTTSGSSGSNIGSSPRSPSVNSCAVLRKKKKVNKADLPWVVQNKLFGSEL